MLYDFTKLQTLITVAKECNVSRASHKLGLSQPAISSQLRYLENYFKFKIIERKKSGIRLTNSGEMLLKLALKNQKLIFEYQKNLLLLMPIQKEIKIACSSYVKDFILNKYIKPTSDYYNKISYYVSDDIEYDLDMKVCDIAITEKQSHSKRINSRLWISENLGFVSNKQADTHYKKDRLREFVWVLPDKDYIHLPMDDIFDRIQFRLRDLNVCYYNDVMEAKRLLKGDGKVISLLPLHTINNNKDKVVPVKFYKYTFQRDIFLECNKNPKEPIVDNIVNFIIFNS